MLNQRQIRHFTYSTVAAMESAVGRDGLLCFCEETNTKYRFIASGSAYTVDNLSVLSTGAAGDTRWVGMYGDYAYNNNSASTSVTQSVTSLASTALEAPIKIAILNDNTAANLGATVCQCETTTGMTASNCTISTDASHKVFGSYGIKVILTSDSGTVIVEDIFAKMKAASYYFISAYLQNGNATNIAFGFISDDTSVSATAITATTFNRVGVVIQPSDFDTATYAQLTATITGSATQYAYFDSIQVIEITSAEYALGAALLLLKYPYFIDLKSSDKCRVKSIGIQRFNQSTITDEYKIVNTTGALGASGGNAASDFIRIKSTETLYIGGCTNTTVIEGAYYDEFKTYISGFTSYTGALTIPSNAAYIRFTVNDTDLSTAILGSSVAAYQSYKESIAIMPQNLQSVSSTIYDTYDCLTGLCTKNVSDIVTLSGNAYAWEFVGDYSNYKGIRAPITVAQGTPHQAYKYNNKSLSCVTALTAADQTRFYTGSYFYITISDTDTGWDESWTAGTSFTGMTWGGLIKAYMNGWELTTANANVASCVWTGIASGTTQSAGSGYTYVTTTIDAGFQPYRMLYQLATPVPTQYNASSLSSYPSGTIIVEPYVETITGYTTTITIPDTTKPISSLVWVNKITQSTNARTPISISSCTVASDGLSFTISGAAAGEIYEYGYNYIGLSTIPTLTYSLASTVKAVVNNSIAVVNSVVAGLQKQINYLMGVINSMFQEQTSVAVSINSIQASETSFLDLSVASTKYIVRDIRLVCADPGADTVTVKLYQLVNDVLTVVDTFAITTANYTADYTLMDLFGIPSITGSNIKITVQSSSGTYAVTGQYSYGKST